jgi:hypothetical protein
MKKVLLKTKSLVQLYHDSAMMKLQVKHGLFIYAFDQCSLLSSSATLCKKTSVLNSKPPEASGLGRAMSRKGLS